MARPPHRPALRAVPTGGACGRPAPWPAGSRADDARGEQPGPNAVGLTVLQPRSFERTPRETSDLRLRRVAVAGEISEKLRKVLVIGTFRGQLGRPQSNGSGSGSPAENITFGSDRHSSGKWGLGGRSAVRNPAFSLSATASRSSCLARLVERRDALRGLVDKGVDLGIGHWLDSASAEIGQVPSRAVGRNAPNCRSSEVGALELGLVEVGALKLGLVEVGALELGFGEESALELGLPDVGALELGMAEVGALELSVSEAGSLEFGSLEVGALELGMAEVGALEVRMAEVGALKVRLAEVGALEVGDPEVGALELGWLRLAPWSWA